MCVGCWFASHSMFSSFFSPTYLSLSAGGMLRWSGARFAVQLLGRPTAQISESTLKTAQQQIAVLRRANQALKAKLFRLRRQNSALRGRTHGRGLRANTYGQVSSLTTSAARVGSSAADKRRRNTKKDTEADVDGKREGGSAQHEDRSPQSAVGIICSPPFCQSSMLPAVLPGVPY